MMKKETYLKCMEYVKSQKNGVKIICFLGKLLTYVTAVCYSVVLFVTFFSGRYKETAVYIAVPGVSFVLLSLFRSHYNAARPYEIYGFVPLIPKDTVGKSFPSRHVFSIFVIGSSIMYGYPDIGINILCMGVMLAAIRVIVGVHFPKDVIAGGIIGMLCGVFAFCVLLFWR